MYERDFRMYFVAACYCYFFVYVSKRYMEHLHVFPVLLKQSECIASPCLRRASVTSWWRSWSTLRSPPPPKDDPTP